MVTKKEENFAEVVGVYPNKVEISVDNLDAFKKRKDEQTAELKVGSYLEISDDKNCKLMAIIENYSIEVNDEGKRKYIIEANPLGTIIDGKFSRGSDSLTIPPTSVQPASHEDIERIYKTSIKDTDKFCFSSLALDESILVPINGNKFFNKHFAVVGSTGSGKSHTVAAIIQQATKEKKVGYDGLNNSHVVIFDIHGEYKKAFPEANNIDSSNIKIPYWLFDSDELGDLFIESNEDNSHNQVSQFRYAVTENKKINGEMTDKSKVYFDSPLKFKIDEVIKYIKNINNEVIGKLEGEGVPKKLNGQLIPNRLSYYFSEEVAFCASSTAGATKASNGPFHGDFERFILRLETIRNNPRLKFLFDGVDALELEDILKQFLGYSKTKSNVTIIDLSGIPFEVLSITVSLISRILFEYGYYYKKLLNGGIECETPLLLVYEEAHKYVPRSDLVKYRASRNAIERIAKEGRKYGVTLGIISQRPSEISETIFSQCNNFVAMRLTNPDDQNYVKRLLPDTLANLTDTLPSLSSGEALLIGESIIIPSIIKIDKCVPAPKSEDIPYLEIWKEKWKEDVDFPKITDEWKK
jgi:DNA helicase HerA-like ATPase